MDGACHDIVTKIGEMSTVHEEPFIGRTLPQVIDQITETNI